MASNYTGNPTAVQAPASAPGPGVALVVSLPADTDGASWANIYQEIKANADAVTWLMRYSGLDGALFGYGTDGAADLNGVNTYSWAVLTGGNIYTLSGDVNLTDLTIRTGITLRVASVGNPTYRVYGRGTCTVEGTGKIEAQQFQSTGPTAQAGPSAGTVAGGGIGGNGAIGAGSAGTSVTSARGGGAGAGGTGSGGAGGAGGTSTAPVASKGSSNNSFGMFMGHILGVTAGTSTPTAIAGGAGGGGGGGNGGANGGGGGGAGGGVICFSFRSIVLANATAFSAPGGPGNTPVGGSNQGGGGGGGGGYIRIVCVDITVTTGTLNAATCCPAGAGAAGSGTGTAGAAGSTGAIEIASLIGP